MYRKIRRRLVVETLFLAVVIGALTLLSGCEEDEEPEVETRQVDVVAELPGGSRAGIAAVVLEVDGAELEKPLKTPLGWMAEGSPRVPVGTHSFRVRAVGTSGNTVYSASRSVNVGEFSPGPVRFREWQETPLSDCPTVCAVAAGMAVLVSLVVGLLGRRDDLLMFAADYQIVGIVLALLVAAVTAAAGVLAVQGVDWIRVHSIPSVWLFVIPVVTGIFTCIELRVEAANNILLGSVLVGGIAGGVSAVAVLGYPVVMAAGIPWLLWAGVTVGLALLIRIAFNESF